MWFFLQTALTLFNTFKLTLLLCAQFPPFAMTLCNEISLYQSIGLSAAVYLYLLRLLLPRIDLFCLECAQNWNIHVNHNEIRRFNFPLHSVIKAKSRQISLARSHFPFYSPAQPSALSQFHPVPSTLLLLDILRPLCGVRSRGLVEYPTTVLSECWVPELMRL